MSDQQGYKQDNFKPNVREVRTTESSGGGLALLVGGLVVAVAFILWLVFGGTDPVATTAPASDTTNVTVEAPAAPADTNTNVTIEPAPEAAAPAETAPEPAAPDAAAPAPAAPADGTTAPANP
jgi:predicted lipid-binding transport protein (Tim44 family)